MNQPTQTNHISAQHVKPLHLVTFIALQSWTPAVYSNKSLETPIAFIRVSAAVMSNSAGGVMTVVAQGAHKLGLVSMERAEENMTQVRHKARVCRPDSLIWVTTDYWETRLTLRLESQEKKKSCPKNHQKILIFAIWIWIQGCSQQLVSLAYHKDRKQREAVQFTSNKSVCLFVCFLLQVVTSWNLLVTVRNGLNKIR